MAWRTVLPTAVLACTLAARPNAAPQAPPAPMTPGDLVVMASQPPPTFGRTLIDALADPRPEMRLTAARISGVQGQARFLPVLFQVRDREANGAALQEVLRAIRVLSGELPTPSDSTPTNSAQMSTMITASAIYPGFFASLVRATGCRASASSSLASMSVAYRANGNPESVAMGPDTSAPCRTAMLALAQVTYTTQPVTAGARQWIVLPLDNEAVACADAPPGAFLPPSSTESRLEPVKVRDSAPRYPAEAKQAGAEGLVILEATISSTGCVRDVSALRQVRASLGLAAIEAVSQWRYTPPVSTGRAFATRMTLTVDFRLGERN